jgi:hypothetical protein
MLNAAGWRNADLSDIDRALGLYRTLCNMLLALSFLALFPAIF